MCKAYCNCAVSTGDKHSIGYDKHDFCLRSLQIGGVMVAEGLAARRPARSLDPTALRGDPGQQKNRYQLTGWDTPSHGHQGEANGPVTRDEHSMTQVSPQATGHGVVWLVTDDRE